MLLSNLSKYSSFLLLYSSSLSSQKSRDLIKILNIYKFSRAGAHRLFIRQITMSENKPPLLERARNIVPGLEPGRHKGQAGRIGVVGGSMEYTGAPYFAAISALKVGADLVHVFCPQAAAQKPLIIDADGLYLITHDISLVKDYYGVILTPNAIEFCRLFGDDRDKIMQMMEKLGRGVTVIEKGLNDRIYDSLTLEKYECPQGGSGRRCGGQGDLLSGALATFYFWALESREISPAVVACTAASFLTKNCNSYAYKAKGRSMTCSDMIEQIHSVFEDYFEHKKE
ncbi:ATP-dependent (S)-NAD(P)H-hydrate dehydratase isoform X2 [Malaya genurostris]|uniref:ATP-dependent (S)-NAD(P)H-hydrate dehydratase isoform X2 n=1 Tax=Malaya genurostris TaxID=325434 RepID=UPI0026F3F857|nr:ATP-dependent (S)-NAD(P)H-hydrate dehydratase isoform X2 [Malaya genurostris]